MSMIGKTIYFETPALSGNFISARVSGEFILENCANASQNIHRLILDTGNEITMDRAYQMKSCPQPLLSGD